ncbi:MAG: hypothetical protein H6923_04920 [Alphaproteobacteria bacterium]|nr:hypothetical protein [Alphaproteobacteria bacterium]
MSAQQWLKRGLAFLGLATMSVAAPAQAAGDAPPHVEITIHADGRLLVDGVASSLDELDKRLAELASAHGIVWYYREELPGVEPPAIIRDVLSLIMKYRLPISFSSKPDFSDTIDDKGVSHPRKK